MAWLQLWVCRLTLHWLKTGGVEKLTSGQSVPLTGAADQIGLSYLNGGENVVNSKDGASGFKIKLEPLDMVTTLSRQRQI